MEKKIDENEISSIFSHNQGFRILKDLPLELVITTYGYLLTASKKNLELTEFIELLGFDELDNIIANSFSPSIVISIIPNENFRTTCRIDSIDGSININSESFSKLLQFLEFTKIKIKLSFNNLSKKLLSDQQNIIKLIQLTEDIRLYRLPYPNQQLEILRKFNCFDKITDLSVFDNHFLTYKFLQEAQNLKKLRLFVRSLNTSLRDIIPIFWFIKVSHSIKYFNISLSLPLDNPQAWFTRILKFEETNPQLNVSVSVFLDESVNCNELESIKHLVFNLGMSTQFDLFTRDLSSFEKYPNLKYLNISFTDSPPDLDTKRYITLKSESIVSLSLNYESPSPVKYNFENIPNLKNLAMRNCIVENNEIFKNGLKKLEYLELGSFIIKNSSVVDLPKSISKLKVSQSGKDDYDIDFKNLKNLEKLTEFDMSTYSIPSIIASKLPEKLLKFKIMFLHPLGFPLSKETFDLSSSNLEELYVLNSLKELDLSILPTSIRQLELSMDPDLTFGSFPNGLNDLSIHLTNSSFNSFYKIWDDISKNVKNLSLTLYIKTKAVNLVEFSFNGIESLRLHVTNGFSDDGHEEAVIVKLDDVPETVSLFHLDNKHKYELIVKNITKNLERCRILEYFNCNEQLENSNNYRFYN